MKKFIMGLFLIIVWCSLACYSVSAEMDFDGYIVKLAKDSAVLLSNDDKVQHIGNEYYKAESVDDVYEAFSEKNVELVFPDYKLELFDSQYPMSTSDTDFTKQWNLDVIKAESAREKGIFGNDIKIAVLDSGINSNHSDLNSSRIMQGYNCMSDAENVTDVSDNYGHGTMVCGIITAVVNNQTGIAGIADRSYIIPIKITDGKNLSLSSLYSGIEKAIEMECDIINLSLGGALSDEKAIGELKSWIDKAYEAGIITVAAVGNGGTSLNYPAAFDNVIGVGSIDKNKQISTYSQYNESVFVVAPGESVITLSKDGKTTTGTGTSFAAPHVSAVIALIKEIKPDCTMDEVKKILINTAVDCGEVGYDIYYGNGLIDLNEILNYLGEYIPAVMVSEGVCDDMPWIYVHNNRETEIKANGYFAKYSNGRLEKLDIIYGLALKNGVTGYSYNGIYDCFMIWDSNLMPYTDKYTFD